jgi:hypothetical protein
MCDICKQGQVSINVQFANIIASQRLRDSVARLTETLRRPK